MPRIITGHNHIEEGSTIVQAKDYSGEDVRQQLKVMEELASRDAIIWQRFEEGARRRNASHSVWKVLLKHFRQQA